MKKSLTLLAALLVATLLSASQCPVIGSEDDAGGSGDGGRSDGGSHVNPGTINDLCTAMNRCSDRWGTALTQPRCTEYLQSMFDCPLRWGTGDRAIELRFELDEARAGACIQAMNGVDCNEFGAGSPTFDACNEMLNLVGAVGAGASCDSTGGEFAACRSGLDCVSSQTEGVCSVCMAKSQLNETCGGTSDRECGNGLYCTTGNVCAALKDVNATCANETECKTRYCPATVCTMPPAKNEACGVNERCGGALHCSNNICVEGKGENETCQTSDDCLESLVCANLKCTYLDYCSQPAVGQPCLFECASGAYCSMSSTDQVCKAFIAANQPCTSSDRCSDGNYCNSSSDTCQPYAQAGDACGTNGALCETYEAYCDFMGNPMQCIALKPNGQGCTSFSECQSYYCDSTTDLCADETCTMP